jgi:hypothetical protein
MRNMMQMGFWKCGWVGLVVGALAFSLGACRTQEGPVIQKGKDNREQTGAFELKGLEVQTFTGLRTSNVLQATSATLDLAKSLATLNQVSMHYTSGTQETSETQEMTFRSGSGVFYTKTPAPNQAVPEYMAGERPQEGDVYLEDEVDISYNGTTIKAPSLFYLNAGTSQTATDLGTTDTAQPTIVGGGGGGGKGVEVSMPVKGSRYVIEADSFVTTKSRETIRLKGGEKRINIRVENLGGNVQNENPVGQSTAGENTTVAPAAETKVAPVEPRKSAPVAPKSKVKK